MAFYAVIFLDNYCNIIYYTIMYMYSSLIPPVNATLETDFTNHVGSAPTFSYFQFTSEQCSAYADVGHTVGGKLWRDRHAGCEGD